MNESRSRYRGRTASEGAAENERIDMLKHLLKAGALIYGDVQQQYERALNYCMRQAMDIM